MAKSVMIDNVIHENLLQIQKIIYTKTKFNMNLGDIVSKLIGRDPEMVAEEVLRMTNNTLYKE